MLGFHSCCVVFGGTIRPPGGLSNLHLAGSDPSAPNLTGVTLLHLGADSDPDAPDRKAPVSHGPTRRGLRNHRNMFVIMGHSGDDELQVPLEIAAQALASQHGCERVWVGRSADDPTDWQLVSQWRNVGSLRKGLGAYDVKMALGPLQASSSGGGVYESLLVFEGEHGLSRASDRASDADVAGPGNSDQWRSPM